MKANRKIGCLFVVFFLVSGSRLLAQAPEETDVEEVTQSSRSRFSVSGKIAYHTFWKQGLLENGADFGRPGLGVGDLVGVGGEADLDYHWRPYMVFTVTAGAYQGKSSAKKVDVITGYGLITAKLQRPGRIADYYVGAGLGGYFSRMKADDTAQAFKPGMHGLIGIRVHVNPAWSILLEDRLAFTLRAEEGFGDLDLGGNFVLLGGSYHF